MSGLRVCVKLKLRSSATAIVETSSGYYQYAVNLTMVTGLSGVQLGYDYRPNLTTQSAVTN